MTQAPARLRAKGIRVSSERQRQLDNAARLASVVAPR
jgi:hypothetical protein